MEIKLGNLINGTVEPNEYPVIHWSEARKWRGNNWAVLPHSSMLIPGGDVQLRTTSIGGGGSGGKARNTQTYRVVYDRDYCVAWLENTLLRAFGTLPYKELQKLISEALREVKAKDERIGRELKATRLKEVK